MRDYKNMTFNEFLHIRYGEIYEDYKKLLDENERLKRENFGLKNTVKNLKEKVGKSYDSLSMRD